MMTGWRMAFLCGNAEVVQALLKRKSYLDYGTFQPIQIAATVTMSENPEYPSQVRAIYESRRNTSATGAPGSAGACRDPWDDVRPGPDPRAVPRARIARLRLQASRPATASGPAAKGSCASR